MTKEHRLIKHLIKYDKELIDSINEMEHALKHMKEALDTKPAVAADVPPLAKKMTDAGLDIRSCSEDIDKWTDKVVKELSGLRTMVENEEETKVLDKVGQQISHIRDLTKYLRNDIDNLSESTDRVALIETMNKHHNEIVESARRIWAEDHEMEQDAERILKELKEIR